MDSFFHGSIISGGRCMGLVGRRDQLFRRELQTFCKKRIMELQNKKPSKETFSQKSKSSHTTTSFKSIIFLILFLFIHQIPQQHRAISFLQNFAQKQSDQIYYMPAKIKESVSRFLMIYYLGSSSAPRQEMHGLMDSDSQHRPLSPTVFIADLSSSHPQPEFELEQENLTLLQKRDRSSVEEGTLGSDKCEKKRLAGLKSRQKKKRQLDYLEETVKTLKEEIEHCDTQISTCKDQLVEALKTATSIATEHSYTFAELQRATRSGEDLDRVNLLLDLIQNRIGANGSERQAKLDYNFKQIINSLFPAMHRYLMHAAKNGRDVFGQEENAWTTQCYSQIKLSQQQREMIAKRREALTIKRRETISVISKLKTAKQQLKNQEEIFERVLTHIREDMNPIQSAQLILFGQRNKLRKQFSIFCDQLMAAEEPKKRLKTQ